MSAFLLALVICALVGFGGRDFQLVAHLSERFGRSPVLLSVAVTSAGVTAILAAMAGDAMAGLFHPDAKAMLAAIAMILAAVELAWPWRGRDPAEPTRSAVATMLVLAAMQIGDGSRFLIFAIAIAMGDPALAAAGGAIGSSVMLALAWAGDGQVSGNLPVRPLRLAFAAMLGVLGVVVGLIARGLI